MAKTYAMSEIANAFGFHSSKALKFLESRGIKPVRTVTTAKGYAFREYGKDAMDLVEKYRVYKAAKAAGRIPFSYQYKSMEQALEYLKEQDELAANTAASSAPVPTEEPAPLVTPKMIADAMMTATEQATPEMTFEVIADPDSLRSMVKRLSDDMAEIKSMLANINRELGAVSIQGFDDEATTHSNGRAHS